MDDNTLKAVLALCAMLGPLVAGLSAWAFASARRELADVRGDLRDLKTQTNGLTARLVEVNRSDAGQEGETRGRRIEKANQAERVQGAITAAGVAAAALPPPAPKPTE